MPAKFLSPFEVHNRLEKALGLTQSIRSFKIEGSVDTIVTATVEFFLDEEAVDRVTQTIALLDKANLVPLADE